MASAPSTASAPSGPEASLEGADASNSDARRRAIARVEFELREDGLQPVSSQNLGQMLQAFK